MVKTAGSIQFDVERTRKAFEEKDWTMAEWARESDVSEPTLHKWLRGERLKIRTIDAIVRPFGWTALELIVSNGKKK